jgi:hypothetical protein
MSDPDNKLSALWEAKYFAALARGESDETATKGANEAVDRALAALVRRSYRNLA